MPETIEQLRAENERLKARITELETVATELAKNQKPPTPKPVLKLEPEVLKP